MAKKNAPAALQTEVTTDEEWAKILERKGLVGETSIFYLQFSLSIIILILFFQSWIFIQIGVDLAVEW